MGPRLPFHDLLVGAAVPLLRIRHRSPELVSKTMYTATVADYLRGHFIAIGLLGKNSPELTASLR